MKLLFGGFYPTIEAYNTVAELYGTISAWSVLLLIFYFFIPVYSFVLAIRLVGLVRFKVVASAVISSTILAIIIGGIDVHLSHGHLSDVILWRLIQMFMMFGVIGSVYLFARVIRKKKWNISRYKIESKIRHLSYAKQLGFLSLTFLTLHEVYNYGFGYNSYFLLRVFIYIPILIGIGSQITKSNYSLVTNTNSVFERLYTIFIVIILVTQLVLMPLSIGEIACKIPWLNECFKCDSIYLWEWQQADLRQNRQEYYMQYTEKRNEQEKEEKKRKIQEIELRESYELDSSKQLDLKVVAMNNEQISKYLTVAKSLKSYSKPVEPFVDKKFETDINTHIQKIRDNNILQGESKMIFKEPNPGSLDKIKKKFEVNGNYSFPNLYYYLLNTHIPYPYVDSLRITDLGDMIDDFYLGFENGIVFKYDFLPEQGDSFYCLFPTDNIESIREIMRYLLKDFNSSDELFTDHGWITPNYYGSEGVGCSYRILKTEYGVLVANYCGC